MASINESCEDTIPLGGLIASPVGLGLLSNLGPRNLQVKVHGGCVGPLPPGMGAGKLHGDSPRATEYTIPDRFKTGRRIAERLGANATALNARVCR